MKLYAYISLLVSRYLEAFLRYRKLQPLAIFTMAQEVKLEYDAKGMPFRRLGSSGLRVPLLSLGACKKEFISTG